MRSLKFYAERANYGRCVSIYVVAPAAGEKERLAKPLEFGEPLEPGETVQEPTIFCHGNQAQMLMDALWTAGLRPTEGSGSAGSLAATERHLKDMQTIAFAALKRDGIE